MGFFNVGYQAWNREGRWIAYPFVGVGGGGATLTFEQTGPYLRIVVGGGGPQQPAP